METTKRAKGPPKIIPIVAVKKRIRAFEPKPIMALRSTLSVIKINAAGNKKRLAKVYKLDVEELISTLLTNIEGII